MSIQLIVFPQSYKGQYNLISTGSTNNLLVDGVFFMTLTNIATTVQTTFFNFPAIGLLSSLSTWRRFITTGVTAPTASSGNAVLYALTTSPGSGIFQQVSLVNGLAYTLTVTLANTSASGNLRLAAMNGAAIVGQTTSAAGILSSSFNFTATNNIMTMIIAYGSTVASDTCTIDTVTLVEQGSTPTFNTHEVNNGQVILDLYEDENIPLTLSVDDFKNAAEKVQSYSKAFKLPATKRNNKIFDNIFEITRSDDGVVFNPYRKTQTILKQDGFVLFEGYLRLIDITDKNGEISYNINLYSEAVALADVLGDLTFSNLDFEELNGDYNQLNIRESFTGEWVVSNPLPISSFANNTGVAGATTTNVIKFPFVDWEHQYTIDSSGMPVLPTLESSFRPFIKIKYLIDKIFNQQATQQAPAFPFSYTSEFFNSADFGALFMDFNWGEAQAPAVFDLTGALCVEDPITVSNTSFGTVDFTEYNSFPNLSVQGPLPPEIGYSSGVFSATTDNQTFTIDYEIVFDPDIAILTQVEARWLITRASGFIEPPINLWTPPVFLTQQTYSLGPFTCILNIGDTLVCQVKKIVSVGNAVINSTATGFGFTYQPAVTINTSATQTTTTTLLQTLRGELNQWEFLKGIMTMFNLVAIPDKSDKRNIIIEPYKDIFINSTAGTSLKDRSISHDWTDKIDTTQIKMKPLTELNKRTIFKFVEDEDDQAFKSYKSSVQQHLYGSKVYNASGFTILVGEEEIVAEPFAATVPSPLMPQYTDFIVPSIYSYNPDDGTSEAFDNSPRIMYDNGEKTLAVHSYTIPAQNGMAQIIGFNKFLQFSHLNPLPGAVDGTDFHFGECQYITGVGVPPVDNLFNTYWLPYFAELYNADTRTMELKVNLNAGDISKFNLYDTVFIKQREFRVNKINYKPGDLATVEFILVPSLARKK